MFLKSSRMFSALSVVSLISDCNESKCRLYSRSAPQISSWKSSIRTKSGKNGRISSILSKSQSFKKFVALKMGLEWEMTFQFFLFSENARSSYCFAYFLICFSVSTTYLAICSHNFFRRSSLSDPFSDSSSRGISAIDFARLMSSIFSA